MRQVLSFNLTRLQSKPAGPSMRRSANYIPNKRYMAIATNGVLLSATIAIRVGQRQIANYVLQILIAVDNVSKVYATSSSVSCAAHYFKGKYQAKK